MLTNEQNVWINRKKNTWDPGTGIIQQHSTVLWGVSRDTYIVSVVLMWMIKYFIPEQMHFCNLYRDVDSLSLALRFGWPLIFVFKEKKKKLDSLLNNVCFFSTFSLLIKVVFRESFYPRFNSDNMVKICFPIPTLNLYKETKM